MANDMPFWEGCVTSVKSTALLRTRQASVWGHRSTIDPRESLCEQAAGGEWPLGKGWYEVVQLRMQNI